MHEWSCKLSSRRTPHRGAPLEGRRRLDGRRDANHDGCGHPRWRHSEQPHGRAAGPPPRQDWQLFEKHAHFNRERIPERVVPAKGSGAYGTLTVTGDITQYHEGGPLLRRRQADVLLLPVLHRGRGERGAADAERDVRASQ